MVSQASTYLFEASKGRFYFSDVRILVPMTWKSKPKYLMPKRESYDKVAIWPWAFFGWEAFDDCFYFIRGLYESKCTFIPDKSQTARDSIMFMQNLNTVVEFCTEKTHNTEAPNLQNKMCNRRSTWDVIKESSDFQNASPTTAREAPPPPTFSLLKAKQRVVCLVLDKSESMKEHIFSLEDRASYLITKHLIKPTKSCDLCVFSNLFKSNSQKLTHCFSQAITSSDQRTSGSEIILVTNGEDKQISSCFEAVKHSGAIIHTIALGPDAARELETLSTMTGGLRFYANRDITGLMDAFCGISSGSGDILQRTLQLESKTLDIAGRKQISGTVPVDSTIGNDTFFVVTWTVQKPEIILQDPKGKKYTTSDFKDDKLNIRSAQLQIPGIAETGTWTYSLSNENARSQLLTLTVTTRARSPTVSPVMATAHMSHNTAQYPSPMMVYARVSQGFLPVLGASVTAVIEAEDGHRVTLELWDNGAGADTVKNDGIYTRYFTDYHGNGRYSLKVHVQARKNTARLSLRQQNKSLYIPGYIEDGKIIMNPPRPEIQDAEAPVEDFSRLTSGESFTVSGAPPAGDHAHVFPPSKVTDLEAEFKGDHIHLTWTAPGKVLDKGRVIILSEMALPFFPNSMFYIAIQAVNEVSITSEISNIAQAVKFIAPEQGISALGPNI
uniref:Calcium-activated chloride channel N-terminal domain-containing protein n=1 Tax=Cricetulus griseus TaxID=10029 RepID=A0A8C2MY19_CRIGR